jgi:hypothetical protein
MKIVISGDSFTFGHGCKDRVSFTSKKTGEFINNFNPDQGPSEYSWPSLLQKKYPEHKIINLAFPGVDNTYIFKSIIDHIDGADIVFVGSTSMNRMQIATSDGLNVQSLVFSSYNTSRSNGKIEYEKAIELFLKHLYTESYFASVFVSTIWAVYGQCLKKNIPFIWSVNIETARAIKEKKYESLLKSLDQLKTFEIEDLCYYFHFNRLDLELYLHEDSHANEYGHEYYFNHEILPVFSKLINSLS